MPPDYQDDSFEWDYEKSRSNFIKHGISFEEVVRMYDDFVYEYSIDRPSLGEKRHIALGLCRDKEYTAICTMRGDRRRIISARRARDQERDIYWDQYHDYTND